MNAGPGNPGVPAPGAGIGAMAGSMSGVLLSAAVLVAFGVAFGVASGTASGAGVRADGGLPAPAQAPAGDAQAAQPPKNRGRGDRVSNRPRKRLRQRPEYPLQPGRGFRDCPACPEMVAVPAGRFRMGSPAHEPGRSANEGPQRLVTIRRPFALGRYEVSFAEWDACLAAGGCNGYRPGGRGWGRGRMPVIDVSWRDARAYVLWLARRTGRPYRLPSEAEWEYAARAGTAGRWSFGRRIAPDLANYRPADPADPADPANPADYRGRPAPAGSFPPNRFGLHDMHGNVYEWVEDCWHGGYAGARGKAMAAGRPWVAPEAEAEFCEMRVLRGGSWIDLPHRVRAAWRVWDMDWGRDEFSGFRVALDLGAPPRPESRQDPR